MMPLVCVLDFSHQVGLREMWNRSWCWTP